MEEKSAVLAVLKALGDKIIALEEYRDTEKMFREIAENKLEALQAENDRLSRMLADVQTYVDRLEEH